MPSSSSSTSGAEASVIVSAKVPTAGTGIAAIVKDGIGGGGRGGEGRVNTELPFVGTGASRNHSSERIDGSARWSSSSRSHSISNGAQRRWKGGGGSTKAWRVEWIQVGMLKGLFKEAPLERSMRCRHSQP